MSTRCISLLLLAAFGLASGAELQTAANPIRKVVNMLQALSAKVKAEGERETELFDKFMCYCKNGDGALTKSIADAEAKIGSLTADVETGEAEVKQLKADLKSHQTDRAAAKGAMAEAKNIRAEEAAAFAALSSESNANIAAATKATAAVSKGMSESFLQTGAAQVLRNLVLARNDMEDDVREELTAFLSNGQSYAPASGQIVGLLKQMTDRMTADLNEATATENASIKAFNELMAAKEAQVQALTASIEDKMVRLGNLQVELVEMKEDLDDTGKGLVEDKKFLADLAVNCKTKTAEHEENMKLRSQELLALADTVKVLNDDDALELFKKTLPGGASLLQLRLASADQRQQALAVLQAARRPGHSELNFIALALQGKKVNFGKVLKMIDDMVSVLKAEQQDDNDKKEYCEKSFDLADDKKKSLERSVSNLEKAIEKEKEGIAGLADEIKALQESIVALDKSVADATEQRKQENTDFKELVASDSAAKELLGFAKNRLNKFYNPKLYKAPPARKLSDADRATIAGGGTLAPEAPAGGIAGTGVTVLADVSAHNSVAPPPPPATVEAFSKKSEESNGVIALLDVMIKDLTKELTEAKTTEKLAQEDYEKTMKDASEKRAADEKTLADKLKGKAQLEADLQANSEEKGATTKTLMATLEHIQSLHAECDWLLQYFQVRREARTGEIDSLKTAKSVLSGADYALLETSRSHRSLRGEA